MPDPDLSEFEQYNRREQRKPCRIAIASDSLPADEQKALNAALATDKSSISAGAIIKWCEARGQKVSVSSVASHRNGTCACHAP